MTGHEADSGPLAGRPEHPYTDQFTGEWAWRFEDAFRRLAWVSADPDDFQQRIAGMWAALADHKEEMGRAWMAFVVRKFADAIGEVPPERVMAYRVPPDLTDEPAVHSANDDGVSAGEHAVPDGGSGTSGPDGSGSADRDDDPAAAVRRTLARIERQARGGHEPPVPGVS
jgi:hypothetical protein